MGGWKLRWWSQRFQMIPTMAFLWESSSLTADVRAFDGGDMHKISENWYSPQPVLKLSNWFSDGASKIIPDPFFGHLKNQPGITNDPSANIYHQPGRAGFVLDVTRCCAKVAFNVVVVEILWVHLHVAALRRFLRGWDFCAAKGCFMLWWKHHRGRLWKKLDKLMKNDDGD